MEIMNAGNEKELWKQIRHALLNRTLTLGSCYLGSCPPCSLYKPLGNVFQTFVDVQSWEQETLLEDEIKYFLVGYQSVNIRFVFDEKDSSTPVGLEVNPSIDPCHRSAVHRFTPILINIYTIRTGCYHIQEDYKYGRTACAMAKTASNVLANLVNPIIRQKAGEERGPVLSELLRSCQVLSSTASAFAKIIGPIWKEKLIGGQALQHVHIQKEKAIKDSDHHDIQELFRAGWKIYAEFIKSWITNGVVVDFAMEFMLWPTQDLEAHSASKLSSGDVHMLDVPYILIAELVPAFLNSALPDIIKCGNFASEANNNEKFTNSDMNVGDDTVDDWSSLDVLGVVRKIKAKTIEVSAAIVEQLKRDCDMDKSLLSLHNLLLSPLWRRELINKCVDAGLLTSPVCEISAARLKTVSLNTFESITSKVPLGANLSLTTSDKTAFELVLANKIYQESSESNPNALNAFDYKIETNTLAHLLSITVVKPKGLERLLQDEFLKNVVVVFRVQLQLTVAAHLCELMLQELKRSDGHPADHRSQCRLVSCLLRELQQLSGEMSCKIDQALMTFSKAIGKVASIEEVIQKQNDMIYYIYTQCGLDKRRKVEFLIEMIEHAQLSTYGVMDKDESDEMYNVVISLKESYVSDCNGNMSLL